MGRRRKNDINTASEPPPPPPPPSSVEAKLSASTPVVRKSPRQAARKNLVENSKNTGNKSTGVLKNNVSSVVNNNSDNIKKVNNKLTKKQMNKLAKECNNDSNSREKVSNSEPQVNVSNSIDELAEPNKKDNESKNEVINNCEESKDNCDDKIIVDDNPSVEENSNNLKKEWADDGEVVNQVIEETIICEGMQVDEHNEEVVQDNSNIVQVDQVMIMNEPSFGDEEIVEYSIESVEMTESNSIDNTTLKVQCDNEVNKSSFKSTQVRDENIKTANDDNNVSIEQYLTKFDNLCGENSDCIIEKINNVSEDSSNIRQTRKSSKLIAKNNNNKNANKHGSKNDEEKATLIVEQSKILDTSLAAESVFQNSSTSSAPQAETGRRKKLPTVGSKKGVKTRSALNTEKQEELIKTSEVNSAINEDVELPSEKTDSEPTDQPNQSLPFNFITETNETICTSDNVDNLFNDKTDNCLSTEFDNNSTAAISSKINEENSSSPVHNSTWDNSLSNIESELQKFQINKTDNVETQELSNESSTDLMKMECDLIQSETSANVSNVNSNSSCSDNSTDMFKIASKIEENGNKTTANEPEGDKKPDTAANDSSSGVRRSNRIRTQSLMKQRSRGRGLVVKTGLEAVKILNNQEQNKKLILPNSMSPVNHVFNTPNDSNSLSDNQSETQSDKENNMKVKSIPIEVSINDANNGNNSSLISTTINDYSGDSKKPVKVKSRWRRSSELEMGNSAANRLNFGDVNLSSESSTSGAPNVANDLYSNVNLMPKNVNSVFPSQTSEFDLGSKSCLTTSLSSIANNANSGILSSTKATSFDKLKFPPMSPMIIEEGDEEDGVQKDETKRKQADGNEDNPNDDDDSSSNTIGDEDSNDCENARRDREDEERDKKAEVYVMTEEDERELKVRLSSFEYLKENLYLTERYTNKETKRMLCDCFLTEEEIERGEMGCGEDCLNRLLMIECGSRCTVNDRCTNKRFQTCDYAKCEVFKTQNKGFGLRATANLPAGEFIMEYVGEVVNTKDFRKRAKEYSKDKNRHYYFMALKSDQIIDATMKGNISRFINHSCDPNAETQKWTVNGELRIGFFNRRFIAAGEEITFDYHFQRYGKEAQRCYCESTNCRGWIGETPEEEKEKLEKKEKRAAAIAVSSSPVNVPATAALLISTKVDDKGDREKEPTICTKKKRAEVKTKVFIEDEDLEEEIDKLCTGGLKNRNHTLTLSRLMVRCREMEHRTRLLRLIQSGEQPCRRLFLDYHGLRLIWSYMMDIANIDTDEAQAFKLELLKALSTLPIPNKTMLMDSKVFGVVEKWANQQKPESDVNAATPTEEETSDAAKMEVEPSTSITSAPKPAEETESNDSNDNASVDIALTQKKAQAQENSSEASSPNTVNDVKINIEELATNLLGEWSNLKEVFRIPKKERIEQMKEHEREADYGYTEKEELMRESCLSSMSSYEKHRSDRHYYGSKKDDLDRNRERCSGDHHHHHHHHNHNHSHHHHHHHHHRGDRLDKRKNRDSPDRCSDPSATSSSSSTSSHRFKDKRATNDERTNLVPVPRLTKFERRQLFALKVAKEEEEERIRKQQQELWQQHEARCLALGMNPHTTAAVDPQTGYPLFFNPILGQWQSYPMQEEIYPPQPPIPPDDPQHPHPIPPPPMDIEAPAIPPYPPPVSYPPLHGVPHQPPGIPPPYPVEPHAHYQSNILPTNPGTLALVKEGDPSMYPVLDPSNLEKVAEDVVSERVDKAEMEKEMVVEDDAERREEKRFKLEPDIQRLQDLHMVDTIDGINRDGADNYDRIKLEPQSELGALSTQALESAADQINEQPEAPPVLDLPPKWRCAKDSKGRYYYYHVKERVSQWLPPPPIHIDIQHDSSSSSEESTDDEGSVSSSDADDAADDDAEALDVDDDNIASDADLLRGVMEQINMASKQDVSSPPVVPAPQETKKRRDGLVQERIISPRREMDRVDYRKYKELKEKQRKRKERVKLKEQIEKLKKHRRLNKSKAHARHTAIKLQAIAQSNELTAERKIKDTFRINMANVMVKILNPYRQNDCKQGRITNTEDFKYLARKLTHFVLAKELKHCKSVDELHCNDNVKHKAKDFVRKYMNKFGPVYQRLSDED